MKLLFLHHNRLLVILERNTVYNLTRFNTHLSGGLRQDFGARDQGGFESRCRSISVNCPWVRHSPTQYLKIMVSFRYWALLSCSTDDGGCRRTNELTCSILSWYASSVSLDIWRYRIYNFLRYTPILNAYCIYQEMYKIWWKWRWHENKRQILICNDLLQIAVSNYE